MEDAKDLLPPDVINRVMQLLREFRRSKGHGFVQISVQHGHINGVGRYDNDKYPFKAGNNP